LKPV
jgi:hypothetical protein